MFRTLKGKSEGSLALSMLLLRALEGIYNITARTCGHYARIMLSAKPTVE
jgi:hypothetical protein